VAREMRARVLAAFEDAGIALPVGPSSPGGRP